jgi:hypothetical protein
MTAGRSAYVLHDVELLGQTPYFLDLEDPVEFDLMRRIKQSLAVLDRIPDCQTSTPARALQTVNHR